MESPTSLVDLVASADAVVIGVVVDVQPGLVVHPEDYPDDPREAAYNANLIVEVSDSLSGPAAPGSRLVVEIFRGIGNPFTPDLAEGIPEESSVFMLRDKAIFQERMGNPQDVVEAGRGLYWSCRGPSSEISAEVSACGVARCASTSPIRTADRSTSSWPN